VGKFAIEHVEVYHERIYDWEKLEKRSSPHENQGQELDDSEVAKQCLADISFHWLVEE